MPRASACAMAWSLASLDRKFWQSLLLLRKQCSTIMDGTLFSTP